ncbi:MAG: EAL domain-containing protein [Cycloclasticus sp.]
MTSESRQPALLKHVDETLALPLAAHHKLTIILRQTLEALGADRCWLMYPCEVNAERYLVPVEETTPDYPGANQLKAYSPVNPVCNHIAEKVLSSPTAVDFEMASIDDPDLKSIYKQFKIQSQLGCIVHSEAEKKWAFGVHHCENAHEYSEEDKELLTAVAEKIELAVNQLLDIPSLINAAELSSEILDKSPLAQVIYNTDRHLVYANEAYCNINERPLSEIIDQHGQQYLTKENEFLFNQFFNEIDSKGHAFVQGKKTTGVGKEITVENTGSIITYNGANHYLITSKDITAETEARTALSESVEIQRAVFEASDDGLLVEDVNRHVIAINQNFYNFFNITPPEQNPIETLELLGAGLPVIKNSDQIGQIVSKLTVTSNEKSVNNIYLNTGIILEMDSFPLIHNNVIKGRVWYFKNITDITHSTDALENALDIQHAIMEATDDGLLVEDTNRQLITVNQVFLDTFAIKEKKDSLIAKTSLEVLGLGISSITNAEEIGGIVANITSTSNEKAAAIIHLTNGSVLDMTSFPLLRNKGIHGRVWYFKDITEKHNLTTKLSFETTHDPLTKLMNRRGFDETLKHAIEQIEINDDTHALLYLDLDRFKIINDSSGHSAREVALIEVSQVINTLLRKADILSRVGGDEFCILLKDCSLTVAQSIGEKIRQTIDGFIFKWEEKEYNLGVSIGIISLDSTIESYEVALNLADTSCYLAKEEGRNRIHIHTSSDQAVMQRLQQGNIVSQIQDALRNDNFTCYVQKICLTKTASNRIPCGPCNYEVLVRMLDDKGDIIAPYHFLPPAERYKLMHKIAHWVINNSIQQMATIQEHFGWLSINLSGQTIANEATYPVIVDAIEASGMAAEKLVFEITETAAISNQQVGIQFLEKLQTLGCKVALDDFGTGLSSYEYLKKLPADILKIDGQFIKNMINDPLDLAMVKSINEIGHLMGKETVGEFVENADILNKLQEVGVDYAQGYHLHAPCSMQSLIDECLPNEVKANLNH